MPCSQSAMREAGTELAPADRSAARADVIAESVRFLREAAALRDRVDALLAPLGLKLSDYEILRCLAGRSLSQALIVRQTGTNKVSVCRGVQRLHKHGWVSIVPSPTDKRATLVTLTEAGSARLQQTDLHFAALLADLHRSLERNDRRVLIRIKQSVHRFLQATLEGSPP